MERQKKRVYVYEADFYSQSFLPIEFLGILTDCIDKGATDMEITTESEYESSRVKMYLYLDRDETDLEYEERVASVEKNKRDRVDYWKREVARLQKAIADNSTDK